MKIKDLAIKHECYCSDSSYYGLGFETNYETWSDFAREMGNSDLDYNLVFRFDVKEKDTDENEEGGYYAEIFIVHQRKGRFVPFFIETVTDEDVDSIVEFLKPRYDHLMSLWSPFSDETM